MHEEVVPLASLSPVTLEEETPFYVCDADGISWRTGRVVIGDDAGRYLVQFANQECESVDIGRLVARCNLSIPDPADFLIARVTATPSIHEGRPALARAATEQRQACAALTGLLSSAIDLEPHQLEVVHQPQDRVQRCLLVDEVGHQASGPMKNHQPEDAVTMYPRGKNAARQLDALEEWLRSS